MNPPLPDGGFHLPQPVKNPQFPPGILPGDQVILPFDIQCGLIGSDEVRQRLGQSTESAQNAVQPNRPGIQLTICPQAGLEAFQNQVHHADPLVKAAARRHGYLFPVVFLCNHSVQQLRNAIIRSVFSVQAVVGRKVPGSILPVQILGRQRFRNGYVQGFVALQNPGQILPAPGRDKGKFSILPLHRVKPIGLEG